MVFVYAAHGLYPCCFGPVVRQNIKVEHVAWETCSSPSGWEAENRTRRHWGPNIPTKGICPGTQLFPLWAISGKFPCFPIAPHANMGSVKIALGGGKGGQWQDEIQQDRAWSIAVAENRNSVLYNQKCWSFHDFELKCPFSGQIVLPEIVVF